MAAAYGFGCGGAAPPSALPVGDSAGGGGFAPGGFGVRQAPGGSFAQQGAAAGHVPITVHDQPAPQQPWQGAMAPVQQAHPSMQHGYPPMAPGPEEDPAGAPQGPEQLSAQGPPCNCGVASVRCTVSKDGPNLGRSFFGCQSRLCKFFQWADQEERAAAAQGPPCYCDVPSQQGIAQKEGPNKDRQYCSCARRVCNFFQWADEEPQAIVRGLPCHCGIKSVQATVKKDGPNKDRKFFICPRKVCDYFQWAGEDPQPSKPGPHPCPVCGAPTVQRASRKEGPSKGREYYRCTVNNCIYFQWSDEEARAIEPGPPCPACGHQRVQSYVAKEGPTKGLPYLRCTNSACNSFEWVGGLPPALQGPPCSCGVPSARSVTKKEGPNKDRAFFSCSRRSCQFWQWADAPELGQPGVGGGCLAPPRAVATPMRAVPPGMPHTMPQMMQQHQAPPQQQSQGFLFAAPYGAVGSGQCPQAGMANAGPGGCYPSGYGSAAPQHAGGRAAPY